MADSAVVVTAGTGTNIDTRTEGTNGHHRQVVVLGDPATNDGVAPVDATAGLKVNLGADNDVTVTGTVDLGATDNAVLDTIAAKDFATQTTLAAMNAKMVTGTDIGDVTINNASGASAVNIQDGGNTITVDGTVTANLSATDNAVLDAIETDTTTIAGDTTSIDGKLPALGQALAAASVPVVLTAAQITTLTPPTPQTDALTDTQLRATAVPVSGTVTANLGATDNAVLDDIAAKLATIDADTSTLAAGVSTEYQVDVVGALPAGTNAIGKLAANSGVDIGDVTLTAGTAAIGTLLPPDVDVTAHTNYARKYYTSTGAATDGIIWSPAAGKRWHVVALYFQVSAAATVTFEDDKSGGDDPVLKGEYAANGGAFLTFPDKYPMASGEDAADLTVTTSAGNIYVMAIGYEI